MKRAVSLLLALLALTAIMAASLAEEFVVTNSEDGTPVNTSTAALETETRYRDAAAMLRRGQYLEALNLYGSLGGYKDSLVYINYASAILAQLRQNTRQAIEGFEKLGDFKDSRAWLGLAKRSWLHRFFDGSGFGYVNGEGEIVIPPRWDFAERVFRPESLRRNDITDFFMVAMVFSGKTAAGDGDMEPLTGKYGLVRNDGALVVPVAYDEILWTENGYAAVRDGAYASIYDLVGGERIAYGLSGAGEPGENGFPVCRDGKWGYMGFDGAMRGNGFIWDSALPVTEGRGAVSLDKKHGYVDAYAMVAIEPQYADARAYSEGLAAVKVKKVWGFINLRGDVVIKPKYRNVGAFTGDLCRINAGGKWGMINSAGELIIKAKYTDISEIDVINDRVWIKTNKLWGLAKLDGTVLVKPAWNSFTHFETDGMSLVSSARRFGYIDMRGSVRVPLKYVSGAPFSAGRGGVLDEKGRVRYVDRFDKGFETDSDIPTECLCGFIEGRRLTGAIITEQGDDGLEISTDTRAYAYRLYDAEGSIITPR